MFVIKDFDKDGFKIGGIFFFIIYNIVMYNGVDYVVGYIYVFEGIYIVCYDLLIKVFGGYFYGRVNYEIYVFMIGIWFVFINEVSYYGNGYFVLLIFNYIKCFVCCEVIKWYWIEKNDNIWFFFISFVYFWY